MTERLHLPTIVAALNLKPFEAFYLTEDTDFDQFPSRKRFLDECVRDALRGRRERYDGPRMRYFRDCFLAGRRVPSIEVIVGAEEIEVMDGYHRLCGAILAKQQLIDVLASAINIRGRRHLDNIRIITRRQSGRTMTVPPVSSGSTSAAGGRGGST